MIAEAKFAATQGKLDKKTTLDKIKRKEDRDYQEKWEAHRDAMRTRGVPPKLPNLNSEFGTSYGHADARESVPRILRSITDKYPYGNIHMALRFGPIIIEIGVPGTGGVSITTRDPAQLQIIRTPSKDINYGFILADKNDLAGTTERTVYSKDGLRLDMRYKAIMKQESNALDTDGMTTMDKTTTINQTADRLLDHVRPYLASRVEKYMDSIVNRLLDPELELKWNDKTNNCQTFCDNLIDYNTFGSLFAPNHNTNSVPLYLMSFVCRPGVYIPERTRFTFDVPNGLMEEYLLKFHYGRHDESDAIDTLQEYWHDWGNFEGPIYPYQDLFP
ncbi:hypothetical protein AUP68_16696 [Ilyonectria robusta]